MKYGPPHFQVVFGIALGHQEVHQPENGESEIACFLIGALTEDYFYRDFFWGEEQYKKITNEFSIVLLEKCFNNSRFFGTTDSPLKIIYKVLCKNNHN